MISQWNEVKQLSDHVLSVVDDFGFHSMTPVQVSCY